MLAQHSLRREVKSESQHASGTTHAEGLYSAGQRLRQHKALPRRVSEDSMALVLRYISASVAASPGASRRSSLCHRNVRQTTGCEKALCQGEGRETFVCDSLLCLGQGNEDHTLLRLCETESHCHRQKLGRNIRARGEGRSTEQGKNQSTGRDARLCPSLGDTSATLLRTWGHYQSYLKCTGTCPPPLQTHLVPGPVPGRTW